MAVQDPEDGIDQMMNSTYTQIGQQLTQLHRSVAMDLREMARSHKYEQERHTRLLEEQQARLQQWEHAHRRELNSGFEHVLNTAYQLSHSLIAFGRGELFGVGLGGSVEKLAYLPEPHTDFIMAVWAEETGFAGVLVVLFLFYWLIRHAFEIGRQAIKLERYFAGLLAQGIGIWFGVQVFINIGVASGALPTKGLTLPFVSYGGSAVVTSLLAMGLLMRVDFENRIHMRGGQV